MLFALGAHGALFQRCWVRGEPANWELLGELGGHITSIAVDATHLFGITTNGGLVVQLLQGAQGNRWEALAPGKLKAVVVCEDKIMGAVERNAKSCAIHVLSRSSECSETAIAPDPCWEQVSKGYCLALAAQGANIYTIGRDGCIYQQPLASLSRSSRWQKLLHAPEVTSIAVLDAGVLVGVHNSRVVIFDRTSGSEWCSEGDSGLSNVVAVTSVWLPPATGMSPECHINSCPPVPHGMSLAETSACTKITGSPVNPTMSSDLETTSSTCTPECEDDSSSGSNPVCSLRRNLVPPPQSPPPPRAPPPPCPAPPPLICRAPPAASPPTLRAASPWASMLGKDVRPTTHNIKEDVGSSSDYFLGKDLRKAASCGDACAIEALLQQGAPVHYRDNGGKTALHYAAGCGHKAAVELLLKYDADPNAVDKVGGKPVDEAEYWCVKKPQGASHDQREKNLATLEVLYSHGGTRSIPSERADGEFILKQRKQLERIAEERGIEAPWCSEQGGVSEGLTPPKNHSRMQPHCEQEASTPVRPV